MTASSQHVILLNNSFTMSFCLHTRPRRTAYFWAEKCLLRMPFAVSRAASAGTGIWGAMPAPSQEGPWAVSEWLIGIDRKMLLSPTLKVSGGWQPPCVVSPKIIARPSLFMIKTNSSAAPAVAPLVRITTLFLLPYLLPVKSRNALFI